MKRDGDETDGSWIATAGHCTAEIKKLNIVEGKAYCGGLKEPFLLDLKSATQPAEYEEFEKQPKGGLPTAYDIGVIKSKTIIPVKPVHIASSTNDVFPKNDCLAFGYGNENGLKVVDNPFIYTSGDKIVGRSNTVMQLPVSDGSVFISAADKFGFISEHGDSGGGMVCRDQNGQQKLIGVITQGSIFDLMYNTDATMHFNWLKSKIKKSWFNPF